MSKATNDGDSGPRWLGIPLKQVSLVTLAVQNSLLILMMRYSRTLSGPQYITSTAVFLSELLKLIICLVVFCKEQLDAHGGRFRGWPTIYQWYVRLFGGESEAWKLSIPAILYTIQNNLQYLAVTLLDAATFQVTYQMKILTTALCSVLMLNRTLSGRQWFSLILLTAGVILVQLPDSVVTSMWPIVSNADSDLTASASSSASSTTSSKMAKPDPIVGDRFLGLVAVMIACLLSGLAGVYFEKILKKPNTTLPTVATPAKLPTIWERNVQLAFFSVILCGVFGIGMKDVGDVMENGFFVGYTVWTWLVIVAQATGGLLVAIVVKYADNILKGFATSISIILSSLASVFIFNFQIHVLFVVGSMLVIVATYLYDKRS